jgi:hypothetical protein
MKRFSIILLFIYSLCFSQANKFFFATAGKSTSSYSVYAQAYQTRIIANGGTISAAMLTNLDTYIFKPLATQPTLRAKVLRWSVFGGDQLKAAVCPLYNNADDGSDTLGFTNDHSTAFVDGDLGVGGLTGNGSSKCLNTGFITGTTSGYTLNNCGLGVGVYAKDTKVATVSAYIGNNSAFYQTLETYNPDIYPALGCNIAPTITNNNALWIISRQASTNFYVYKNQSAGVNEVYASGSVMNAAFIDVFSFETGAAPTSTPIRFTNATLSGYIITSGLTQTEAQAIIDMWNNFEKTRNAGYY